MAILAKPEQFSIEQAALRIYQSASFQEERNKAKALFAESRLAETECGRSTIDRASEAMAYQAALYAANYDTHRPYFVWCTHTGHHWNGIDVPPCGYGLDAADNVYRHATLDGSASYVVHGIRHGQGPTQQTFVIYRSIPGLTETMNAEGHMAEIAGIKSEAIQYDADGGFVLTIDANPAGDRPNHLQVEKDLPGLHVMVRDSLADWDTDAPMELSIRRVADGKEAPTRSERESIDLAEHILRTFTPYWLNWFESYVHGKPVNEVVPPWKRVTGWGMTQQGCFALQEGQAWVITLNPLGARFFDFQVSDPWTRALEYVERNGCFNANQAHIDPDGTITLVVSPVDPGVHNWLDTSGLLNGTFQVRWQGLPEDVVDGGGAVLKTEIVQLKHLTRSLPPSTRMLDAAGRTAQLAHRRQSYANRLT